MKPQQLLTLVAALVLGSLAAAILVKPKLGLDIQGGARVVLEADIAQLPKEQKWDNDAKAAVLRTVENRVNSNGVAEPIITPKGDKQYVVEIPAVKNESEILEQLQNTAQLLFYYSPDWKSNRAPLGRYDFQIEGNRDEYRINDTQTNKTFRDRFHLNLALREMVERGEKSGSGAKDTPLPGPLETLAVAASRKSLPLTGDDAKKLPELAEELTAFDAFLQAARLELTGRDLQPGGAQASFQQSGAPTPLVELTFNSEGQSKFAKFTTDHTNEILMIYLDGRILMAPNIEVPITNGRAVIQPFPTLKDAKKLADYLNGGALPVPLKIVQQQSVEATLGTDAVKKGFLAGVVGMVAIMAFMIGVYRLPGLVACGALLLYTLFSYAAFVLIGVTFTLPGIAGFILSVGMAVDANILIFERTKEELASGKPLRHSVDEGFKRAFSAIFDSNLCSIVTALLLYQFGSGSVRGFALTLMIGVALSMFTAITVSRTLLNLLIERLGKDAAKQWGSGLWRPRVNAVGNRRLWYGLSLAIIVPLAIFAGPLKGFKTGIEFTGGSEITLKFPTTPTREAVEAAVAKAQIKDATAQIGDKNLVFVRVPPQEGKGELTAPEADALVEKLSGTFPGVTREAFERIGSSISAELTRNAIQSIVFSSIFIVLYLAWRFATAGFATGLKFGFAAIIAMLHDVLVLIGVFCGLGYLLNWKIDSLFLTAALTVIGFSVHDTIIIFDRIRENQKLKGSKADFAELVAESIRETFARSVFTSGTVLVTLLSLLVLGGAVIRPLNAALFVGILSGTYSSIFNAAPLVVDLSRWFRGEKK